MSHTFAALVQRVTAQLSTSPRTVTADEYRTISCNRCGVCCEDIPAPYTPADLASRLSDPELNADWRAFLGGLEPVEERTNGWRYRCRHFQRDEDGLGTCGIFERRPAVCRGYPYGGVVRRWAQCAWFVQIVDENGNAISRLPEADAGWDTGVRLS